MNEVSADQRSYQPVNKAALSALPLEFSRKELLLAFQRQICLTRSSGTSFLFNDHTKCISRE